MISDTSKFEKILKKLLSIPLIIVILWSVTSCGGIKDFSVGFIEGLTEPNTWDYKLKNSCLKNADDGTMTEITLGEALESVLEDVKWETVSGAGLDLDLGCEDAVEVTGTFEEFTVLIRYQVYTKAGIDFNGCYSLNAIYFEDEELQDSDYWNLLADAMANFGFEEGSFIGDSEIRLWW
jgi:hypothetical protein